MTIPEISFSEGSVTDAMFSGSLQEVQGPVTVGDPVSDAVSVGVWGEVSSVASLFVSDGCSGSLSIGDVSAVLWVFEQA